MLIRCEKCTIVYELDERLLPPQGAPVQCSKCQFVFKAYPPQTTGGPVPASTGLPPSGQGSVTAPPSISSPGASAQAAASGGALQQGQPEGTAAGGPIGGAAAQPPPNATQSAPRPGFGPSLTPISTSSPRLTADGRPIRKVPFPVPDDLSATPRPSARVSVVASTQRRKPVPWPWIAPILALLIILAAYLIWRPGGKEKKQDAPPPHSTAPAAGGR